MRDIKPEFYPGAFRVRGDLVLFSVATHIDFDGLAFAGSPADCIKPKTLWLCSDGTTTEQWHW